MAASSRAKLKDPAPMGAGAEQRPLTPRRRGSDRAAAKAAAAMPKKPMAMTRRVSLFERDIKVRLATAALDILMDDARVLSEGEVAAGKYAGSTMVTIDLEKLKTRMSDPPTNATANRIAGLYTRDERARARARRLGTSEARRQAKCDLTSPEIDVEARAVGAKLHLSINVEADQRKDCSK